MSDPRRTIPDDAVIDVVQAADGWPLRRFQRAARGGAERGAILWCGGRGDFFEKYLEAFAHWHNRGFSVTSIDWRGQGGSGRLTDNPRVGAIDDFSTWIADLCHTAARWRRETRGPHVIMGHSMGGHLVLRALAERAVAVDAAVLIAPMLGFTPGVVPISVAPRAARFLARIAPRTRPAWKDAERPDVRASERQALLTSDAVRYADELWWRDADPALALGPPNWQWVDAAYRSQAQVMAAGVLEQVAAPILMVGADADRLVDPSAIRDAAARLPDARLLMIGDGCAHEVLRETDRHRDRALGAIDEFLETMTS